MRKNYAQLTEPFVEARNERHSSVSFPYNLNKSPNIFNEDTFHWIEISNKNYVHSLPSRYPNTKNVLWLKINAVCYKFQHRYLEDNNKTESFLIHTSVHCR